MMFLFLFSDTLKAAANENVCRDELDGFITHMKNQKGQALVEWVQKIQENLSLLKPSLEPFVLAILGKKINKFSLTKFYNSSCTVSQN